jgi:hypothetical protein
MHILGLSYEYEVPEGITNVEMRWLSPTRLDVAYKGHPDVVFQVVRCAGIDVSIQDLSSRTGH